MARYVIDAPTLVHVISHDVVVDRSHQLVAPRLIHSQALTRLFEAVRRGELTEPVALEQHLRATETKLRLLGERVSRRTAWNIAREHGFADTYEAEYLAVTRLQADALVTVDTEFAARAEGIVPLEPLAALGVPASDP